MNLLHSCRKAAELISQSLDEPLDMMDSLRLRVHLSMCGNCQNVQEQFNMMHKMGVDIGTSSLCEDTTDTLPPYEIPIGKGRANE